MERLRAVRDHVAAATSSKDEQASAAVAQQQGRSAKDLGTLASGPSREDLERAAEGAGTDVEETFFEFPSGGLFIDDYSQLPTPTRDIEKAKSDLDVYGYCMISEALDAVEIKTIADALMQQSRERYADGLPRRPGANGAGLTGMFNRGERFTELFDNRFFTELAGHALGERMHAQIYTCPFHLDGFQARPLHTDTWVSEEKWSAVYFLALRLFV